MVRAKVSKIRRSIILRLEHLLSATHKDREHCSPDQARAHISCYFLSRIHQPLHISWKSGLKLYLLKYYFNSTEYLYTLLYHTLHYTYYFTPKDYLVHRCCCLKRDQPSPCSFCWSRRTCQLSIDSWKPISVQHQELKYMCFCVICRFLFCNYNDSSTII